MLWVLPHNTHNSNFQGVFPFLLVPQEMVDACLQALKSGVPHFYHWLK